MNLQRWIARRESSWKRLDALLTQIERRGIKSLNAQQIHDLASLYRSTTADLARARTQQVSHLVIQNLQQLTARSYAQIYQGARRQEWQAVWRFYRWGLPLAVQQSRGYLALAIALFMASGLVSWGLGWRDPSFLALVVPENILTQVRDRQELWMGSIVGIEPFASSTIMMNNLKVSFSALAGGLTAGILTVYLVLVNGLMLGAIASLVAQNHLAYPFWAFVFPHGALELPAIFLASAAGFLLAKGLLFPGQYRRVDALKQYGQQAAQLMFGVIPLLIIAGIIEGFFSPSPAIPSLLKYAVGVGLLMGLVRYLSSQKR